MAEKNIEVMPFPKWFLNYFNYDYWLEKEFLTFDEVISIISLEDCPTPKEIVKNPESDHKTYKNSLKMNKVFKLYPASTYKFGEISRKTYNEFKNDPDKLEDICKKQVEKDPKYRRYTPEKTIKLCLKAGLELPKKLLKKIPLADDLTESVKSYKYWFNREYGSDKFVYINADEATALAYYKEAPFLKDIIYNSINISPETSLVDYDRYIKIAKEINSKIRTFAIDKEKLKYQSWEDYKIDPKMFLFWLVQTFPKSEVGIEINYKPNEKLVKIRDEYAETSFILNELKNSPKTIKLDSENNSNETQPKTQETKNKINFNSYTGRHLIHNCLAEAIESYYYKNNKLPNDYESWKRLVYLHDNKAYSEDNSKVIDRIEDDIIYWIKKDGFEAKTKMKALKQYAKTKILPNYKEQIKAQNPN